jgi:hypothetical protein
MATSAMDPDRFVAAPHDLMEARPAPGLVGATFGGPLVWGGNCAHRKIEIWAEHRSWMAVAQWIYATTNQTMVLAVGGVVERRFARVECVGVDV